MATIDVLLPVRNGLPFLSEAIDSIRNQTFADWRLLILDHGSSDGSLALSHRYEERDARINVFSFPDADGLAGLLNAGLKRCDCKYMVRQDADDIAVGNRMAVVDEVFREKPDFLAIGGDAVIIDQAGHQIGYHHLPISPVAITAANFFYNAMNQGTATVNFIALKRLGAEYGKDILNLVSAADSLAINGLAEDYILFGQLALVGPCANLGVPLMKYRRHGATVGTSNPKRQIQLALKVSRFLAKSFCALKNLPEFDPAPFCNHAENVFDFHRSDYTREFERMALALRRGLGPSGVLERELAFRWVLATRNSGQMMARYLRFQLKYGGMPSEWRTVRNWLLRVLRRGKYVYRAKAKATMDEGANVQLDQFE